MSRYSRQCHYCNRQLAKAKSDYYTNMVSNNSESPRPRWNCIHQILHRRPAPSLPNHVSIKSLCDSFSSQSYPFCFPRSYFKDCKCGLSTSKSLLVSFEPATVDEVSKIIMSSPNKSCDLDPLPTILLKACLDTLLKPITDIINTLLCSGLFPDDFLHAHVYPFLKKTSLPKEDLKGHSPVFNLSFISKIREKVVASRLRSHISSYCLSNVSQSAYR